MSKVTTDILRDFFLMLGPKRPVGLFNLTIVPEIYNNDRLFYSFQFEVSEEVKKELLISNRMLPMFASSMENLLLSIMVRDGVNVKIKEMLDFVQKLPKFQDTIEIYFKNQNINVVFEFK